MLRQILRESCLLAYPKLPVSDNFKEAFYFPESVGHYIITNGYGRDPEKLIPVVVGLIKDLGLDPLIFMGDHDVRADPFTVPWMENISKEFQDRIIQLQTYVIPDVD